MRCNTDFLVAHVELGSHTPLEWGGPSVRITEMASIGHRTRERGAMLLVESSIPSGKETVSTPRARLRCRGSKPLAHLPHGHLLIFATCERRFETLFRRCGCLEQERQKRPRASRE